MSFIAVPVDSTSPSHCEGWNAADSIIPGKDCPRPSKGYQPGNPPDATRPAQ
ncbi:hypothetical protein [Corallococcus sp. AB049A]|uniref:hypothetical protein n=1 Tax=Corallococcus sp. AB049A TaxID=2316721 RepID=UPI0013157654|nr:hypothetical protein [Corallococcus sp. AB049A]